MPHTKPEDPEWNPVYTPFEADLYDVVQTAEGQYAVGAGGTLAANRGEGWETVLANGPADAGSTLQAIDVSDDGTRIWFAGSSGAFAAYDVRKKRLHDYSNFGDASTEWQAVGVTGKAGTETVYVANTSGAIVPFDVDGTDVNRNEPAAPGEGAAITALAAASDGAAYAVDTSGNAFRKKGGVWEDIGIVNAQVDFNDIYAGPNATVYVAAGDGRLYRYDDAAKNWTPIGVAETSLRSVDVHQNHIYVLADSNTLYWRTVGGDTRWQQTRVPTGHDLVALALGSPDVIVGKAGTVIVRRVEKKKQKQEGEKHPEDPKTTPPQDPLDPCTLLITELVERLDRDELFVLLEKVGCEHELVSHLEELRTKEELTLRELLEQSEEPPSVVVEAEGLREETEAHAHGCAPGEKKEALKAIEKLLRC